jgi:hypothetical protein
MCHNNDRVDLAIVPHDGLPAVTSHHFTLVFTVNRNVMVSVSDTVSTTMVARLPVTGFLREVACRQKAYDEAHQLAQETVMLNNSIDDRFSKAMALHTLGLVAYAQPGANLDEAFIFFDRSQSILYELGDRWKPAHNLCIRAEAEYKLGEYASASRHFQESQKVACKADLASLILDALAGQADVDSHNEYKEYALELALHVLCHPATGQEAQRRSPRTCALNWKRHSPPSRWPRRNDVCAPETFLHWSKNN